MTDKVKKNGRKILLLGSLICGMAGVIPCTVVHATDMTSRVAATESASLQQTSTESTFSETTTEQSPKSDDNLSVVNIKSIDIVSKKSMRLTWDKNKNMDGYIIYRKVENGDWKKVGTCKGGQKTSYTDKGLTYKQTYAYAVVAYQTKNGTKIYSVPTGEGTTKKLSFYSKYKKGLKYYYDADGNVIKDVEGIIGKQKSYVLKVNTSACVVTVYAKDGKKGYKIPVKSFLCAPGKTNKTGTFYTGVTHRYWILFYNSYSQWTKQIHGNILFHTSPYTKYRNNKSLDVKEYNKMGTRASHGCIRLQCVNMKWIYDNCKGKTKVVIYESKNPGPFGKPELEKLPSWHKWDPTDPASAKWCKKKGCH